MYEIGTLVLYGRTGVCRVEQISETDCGSGAPQKYYILKPLYQTCSITVPADSEKVYIRPIISPEEAKALIAGMPAVQAEPYHNQNLNQLRAHYRECIETHSCQSLVEMTKSLYLKKREAEAQKRKFGAVDERFLKEAEDLLFGELAAALGIERDGVRNFIAKTLEQA